MRNRGRSLVALVCTLALAIVLVPMQAAAGGDPNHAPFKARGVAPAATTPKDAYEPDDTSVTAKPMPRVSTHTFHPLGALNDIDWMYFTVAATGTPVLLETYMPPGALNNNDPFIKVYDEIGLLNVNPDPFVFDGAIAASDDHIAFSMDAGMVFVAPHPGKYWVRVQSDDVGYGQWGEYRLYGFKGVARRLAGATRFDTAVAVSQLRTGYAGNAGSGATLFRTTPFTGLVIANGYSVADASAAGMLAAASGSPLLLTDGPNSLTPATLAELQRLARASYGSVGVASAMVAGPGQKLPLYVVGGRASVSDALVAKLDANPYLGDVVRIAGVDRYSTMAAVMDKIMSLHARRGPAPAVSVNTSFTAFVVSGNAPADIVAAAPVANAMCGPLLLSTYGSLPKASTDWIKNNRIQKAVVIGGLGTVNATAYAALETALGSANVTRVAGTDRYTTCKAAVDWEIAHMDRPINTRRIILVSGSAPFDALTSVPLSYSMQYAPVLLTGPTSLHPTVQQYVNENRPLTMVSYIVGGTGSVSSATESRLNATVWSDLIQATGSK